MDFDSGSRDKKIESQLNDLAHKDESDLLPHEFLLKISQGRSITQRRLKVTYYESGPKVGQVASRDWIEEEHYPTFSHRVSAAKAAAKFFAPALAAETLKVAEDTADTLAEVLRRMGEDLPG